MTHTPGPWHRDDGADKEYGVGYMICDGPHIIAKIAGMGYPLGKGGHPTSDANARLIAAAPDLLAALDALIGLRDKPHGFHDLEWYEPAFDQARAAIAKATTNGKDARREEIRDALDRKRTS